MYDENYQKFLQEKAKKIDILTVLEYGSSIFDETTAKSDIDTYWISNKRSYNLMKDLNQIKKSFQEKFNIPLFINLITKEELESELFTHRGRENLFLFECMNFKTIFGKPLEKYSLKLPPTRDLDEEIFKRIKDFRYINTKWVINDFERYKTLLFKNLLFTLKMFQVYFTREFKGVKDNILFIKKFIGNKKILNYIYQSKFNGKVKLLRKEFFEKSEDLYRVLLNYIRNEYYERYPEKMFSRTKKMELPKEEIIYTEYWDKKLKNPEELIFFLSGFPRPTGEELLFKLFKPNAKIIHLYYPGYWLSSGYFNISELPKIMTIAIKKIKKEYEDIKTNLVGSSFGGLIALTIEDELFDKKLILSPPLKFNDSLIDKFFSQLQFFRPVIKTTIKSKKELKNQINKLINTINTKHPHKCLVITDMYDKEIDYKIVKNFCENRGIKLNLTKTGLHGAKNLNYLYKRI